MVRPEAQPVEINLSRTRHLRIRWADGHESVLPLAVLRRACPCASCRDERRKPLPGGGLPVIPDAAAQARMVAAERVELVGHYALRVVWQDGHDTGIYGFELLRALDEGDGARIDTAAQ